MNYQWSKFNENFKKNLIQNINKYFWEKLNFNFFLKFLFIMK